MALILAYCKSHQVLIIIKVSYPSTIPIQRKYRVCIIIRLLIAIFIHKCNTHKEDNSENKFEASRVNS
jgi:hypothetical protein